MMQKDFILLKINISAYFEPKQIAIKIPKHAIKLLGRYS